VILLDLLMPVMDGFAFLEHLQLDPVWKSIPVVILTAEELEARELLKLRRVGATVLAKGRADARQVVDSVLEAIRSDRAAAREGAVA
jgi:CheY-like chemotaxis protein